MLNATVNDGHLTKNPCAARSVKAPAVEEKRVTPGTPERVFAVRAALPERFQAMADTGSGCAMRPGEILGLAVDAVDFASDTVHGVRQLKLSRGKPVFAPPKGGELRDAPLAAPVADALRVHMKHFPPVDITLPWMVQGGEPVTHRLLFTAPLGTHVWRGVFISAHWKPSLSRRPASSRSARSARSGTRRRASTGCTHSGTSTRRCSWTPERTSRRGSECLGHSDPRLTLRVYAHLMPASREHTRKTVASIYDTDLGVAHEG